MSSQNTPTTLLTIKLIWRRYLSDSNISCNARNMHITGESEITVRFQSERLIDFGNELLVEHYARARESKPTPASPSSLLFAEHLLGLRPPENRSAIINSPEDGK